jgi:hypothetical protein
MPLKAFSRRETTRQESRVAGRSHPKGNRHGWSVVNIGMRSKKPKDPTLIPLTLALSRREREATA